MSVICGQAIISIMLKYMHMQWSFGLRSPHWYGHLPITVSLVQSQIISLNKHNRMLVPVLRSPLCWGHFLPVTWVTVIVRLHCTPITVFSANMAIRCNMRCIILHLSPFYVIILSLHFWFFKCIIIKMCCSIDTNDVCVCMYSMCVCVCVCVCVRRLRQRYIRYWSLQW